MEEKYGEVNKLELEESCGERRQGWSKFVEPQFILAETRGEIWINRPTTETVQRLIEWFSNTGN